MGILTYQELDAYHADGYLLSRGLFERDEIDLLRQSALLDRELDRQSFNRADGEGGTVRLSLWNQPGDSIYGMFARCERIVDSVERILGGEAYHYHSKMILKDARTGGAWTWHQDYGYWYPRTPERRGRTSVFATASKLRRLRSIRLLGRTVACRYFAVRICWDGWTMFCRVSRRGPTSRESMRRLSGSSWFIVKWSLAMLSSFTAISCTARTGTNQISLDGL